MRKYEDFGIRGVNLYDGGQQKVYCPQCQSTRNKHPHDRSLSVFVIKGIWKCHHCGWSGSLYEKKEHKAITFDFSPPDDKMFSFFEKRAINRNTVAKMGIVMHITKAGTPCIAFPYKFKGETVNVKYRTFPEKNYYQTKGGWQTYYNLECIDKDAKEVIITEGEMDCLSFIEAGFNYVVSVPAGAPNEKDINVDRKMQFVEETFDVFEDIERIYIAVDDDASGRRLKDELARRYGKSRCYIVKYLEGCKDGNEVIVKHGISTLQACVEFAEPYPIEGVFEIADKIESIEELYTYGFPETARTGWYRFDEHIKFYPGMLTVITGSPGAGKSNFTDEILMRMAVNDDWRIGVFSPENAEVSIHFARLAEIYTGKGFLPGSYNRMNYEEYINAVNFVQDHFYFINPAAEDFTLERIHEKAKFFVRKYGISALIVDPFATLEHRRDKDLNEQEYYAKMLNGMKYFAREQNLHYFLVAHPRKLEDHKGGHKMPTLYDIAGSAHFYNLTDNGFTVWRNFKSGEVVVNIQKVKHKFIGKLGRLYFKFSPENSSYTETTEFPIISSMEGDL